MGRSATRSRATTAAALATRTSWRRSTRPRRSCASGLPPRPASTTDEEANLMAVDVLGSSVKRKEDPRFITGEGQYLDDIKLSGLTHAYVLRSPYAHARIRSIDTAAAAAVSIERIRAWAYGLRRTYAWVNPDSLMSSRYWPSPV